MKLTGIEIEQFGPWSQLSLPLAPDGLTVISGSNDSGKSALRGFVRGVLFGYRAEPDLDSRSRRLSSSGSLRVRHHGRMWEIRRAAHDGGTGVVTTRWLGGIHEAPELGSASDRDGRDEVPIHGHNNLIEHCDWENDYESEIEPEIGIPAQRLMRSEVHESLPLPVNESAADCLDGLPEALFDHVFSLGLRELHEFNTLSEREVEDVLLGETLGPHGQLLLSSKDQLEAEIAQQWDASRAGSLAALLDQHSQLNTQIQSQSNRVDRYCELLRSRRDRERRLTELQTRRGNLHDQLAGYEHIERVWLPWQRLRQLQAEQLRLPRIDDFPEGGISRFDQIEEELQTSLRCRETLFSEAKQFRRDAREIGVNRNLRQCSAAMRGMLEQREHIGRMEERARQAHGAAKLQKDKLDSLITGLGPDWSLARLETLDTSMAAHYRLVEKARLFRQAVARRHKGKLRLIRLSQKCQEHQAAIDVAEQKLGTVCFDETLRIARQQRLMRQHAIPAAAPISIPIAHAVRPKQILDSDTEQTRLRIESLEERRIGISRQIERLEPKLILPIWVLIVLGFFAVGGVILAMIGFWTGLRTSLLGGAAYAVLGTVCGCLALSLKMHFEQQVRESIGQLNEELRDNEVRLQEAREAWRRLTGIEWGYAVESANSETILFADEPGSVASESSDPSPVTAEEAVQAAALAELEMRSSPVRFKDRLPGTIETELSARSIELLSLTDDPYSIEELEELIESQRLVATFHRQRAPLNERFRVAVRDLAEARQSWCEALQQLGLPESVKVTETFDLWQRVAAVNEQKKTWLAADLESKRQIENVQTFRSRVVEVLSRLNRRDLEAKPTSDIFSTWDKDLAGLTAALQQRLKLRREERRRRAEATGYREQIDELRQQRSALLRQGCATDREDYERRATIYERHLELLQQLDATREELNAASLAAPELAIVEDDLLRFDSTLHSATLGRLRGESDQVEREIKLLNDELNKVEREIERLETDDEPRDLRTEREILCSQIQTAVEEWLSNEWCSQTIDGIRARYERVCQPGILSAASRYVSRLTEGRFRSLWTPLRHRSLRVDDAAGNTLRLDQLGDSTRELLLLSVRLALVEELSQRGVELPLLLDEVLLSLDPSRAAVAAHELIDFARRGHQVLFFTCHPHLSSLFTNSGCPHLRLNQHATADRLAG